MNEEIQKAYDRGSRAADETGKVIPMTERRCQRCRHPDHWHRHDDVACVRTHPQPCDPSSAPFRCLGYDCERPGYPAGTPETRCGCADFVEQAHV